jgi:dTDP-4-dehydrorhamnose reductase
VPSGTTVVPLVRRTPLAGGVVADLRDQAAVAEAVGAVRPDLVVHAAYAKDEASIVVATRHVVEAATAVDAHLVHLSTDAVFSGDGSARDEAALPDPVFDYGRWKAQADEVVVQASPAAAIVRPSLIVSLDPDDHVVAQIRRGAAEGRPTTWYDDELRQPAEAQDLATGIWAIASLAPDERAGTWHLPGPEVLSRYEIAQRVVAALGLGSDAVTPESTPPHAARPRHLRLLDGRARRAIGWAPRPILVATPRR